jgi:23S rRNA pseudouridine2457 synthase
MLRYFIIYKPYQVLSQFSSEHGKNTLKDIFSVPPDVYPVGRLDFDSEGLLILTNDTHLNHRLLNPLFKHEREYWVQVEGDIPVSAVHELQGGIMITVDGKHYRTTKCCALIFPESPPVAERIPPVRFRKSIPTSWIKVILTEGKNRQVRKMTASVGYPTLRLIRVRIENLHLQDLKPGGKKEISKEEIYYELFEHKTG